MGKHDALHGIAKHEREAHLGQSKPQTTTHDMKMKTYAAYAPTSTGKMVAIATTQASSKEDAIRVLSRFTPSVDVRAVVDKLDK